MENDESVYLQLNKSVFELGEDLWFGATILNSQSLLPSSTNSSLFVELRSKSENDLVFKEIFEIADGFTEGHIFLSDTLKQGEYSLFAFTRNSLADKNPKAKSILLKSRIVPTILIDVNFDNTTIVDQNTVSSKIKVFLKSGEAIVGAKINAELWKDNKRIARVKVTTDNTGESVINFTKLKTLDNLTLKIDVDSNSGKEQLVLPVRQSSDSTKIQFNLMPEGGSLVTNIATQLAFKAVDQSGMPFEIDSAVVIDENDAVVTSFKSQHHGMGRFSFLPMPSKQYSVAIILPKVDSVYAFPTIFESGYILNLFRQTKEGLFFAIKRNEKVEKDSLTFKIEQRGITLYESRIMVSDNGAILQVPIAAFPTGIIKAGIADSKGQKLAERLIFVNQQKRLNISYKVNEPNFTSKEKVEIKLKVTDEVGLPVQSAMGMSVVDEVFKSVFNEDNIVSFFFLTNEIKGRVHEPKSYFTDQTEVDISNLDLLLLTQGWRSYRWTNRPTQELTNSELKVSVKIDPNSVGKRVVKNLDRQSIQVISVYGVATLGTDKMGEVLLTDSLLYWSKGARIFFKPDNLVGAYLKFQTPFDLTSTWPLDQFSHQIRGFTSNKNWNILPQIDNDVTILDDFVLVSKHDDYGVLYGGKGPLKGNSTDYVCQYNILNCKNHKMGRKPRDGEQLMINGVLRTYVSPKDVADIPYFTGYYQNPVIYEPDYDKIPENRVFTDFRNSLVWRPNIITDENGEALVTFFTSDIRSIFNVHLDAYGSNGQMGALQFDIKVLK
uniref:hypothetical protein n=2 Tax=Roseivirga sp. TaxID=1964215 RepID=UPI004047F682